MPQSKVLAEIEALFEQGLYVSAFRAAQAHDGGPLVWRDPASCVLGYRILHHVGAPRASRLLLLRAYRAAPLDPGVAIRWAQYLRGRRGLYAALEFLRTFPIDAAAAAEQSDLRLVRASFLCDLRDFEAAELEVRRAEVLAPGDPWLAVQRAHLLIAQDRLPDALDVLRDMLHQTPAHRAAVQPAAHVLVELGRFDEAAALLTEAVTRLESGAIALQLGHLELSRRRPRDAWRWFARGAELFPFIEPGLLLGIAAACCEAACEAGEYAAALNLACSVGSEPLMRLAGRLEAGGAGRRVMLDVPYVRQAHKTCAPATLTALCQFFGRPAEHLAIAEEICFDGTPWTSERRWADKQGFVAREFTVTWETATGLLDRGLPFALTTQAVGSAHAQAIAGYDASAGSFSVRDPSQSRMLLFDVEALLRSQAWAGPRGLVLVPPEQAGRLDGLVLPDAALFDILHAIEQALQAHDRGAAAAGVAELERRAPDHFLATHAARSLAAYDENPVATLAAIDRALQLHPEVPALRATRLACLSLLGRASERRADLEAFAADPRSAPEFTQMLAQDLLDDPRENPRAEALLLRLLRLGPGEATSYRALATVRFHQNRRIEARALLRYAACLADVETDTAASYVNLCLHTGARAEALAFLRDRFERFGRRFTAPALALHDALDACERTAEGLEILERALAWRPEDGALLLGAARAFAAVGQLERARVLHARAREHARAVAWQTVAAHLDVQEGALADARARFDEVLREQPLALDAYRAVAPLDAALAGPSAARARLDAAAGRFPHHAGLARLRVEWTPDEGEAGCEVVRELLRLAPNDAGAHVELALRLGRRGRHDEAEAALVEAIQLVPNSAGPHLARAKLAQWRGDGRAALAALRSAVSLDVDAHPGLALLLSLARTPEERRDALAFARAELRRQVIRGPALAAYREAAADLERPEDTLALLEEARSIRPDLLASSTEVTRQLAVMGRLEEARALAGEAVRAFPLQVDAHFALAGVLARAGAREEQIQTLTTAAALAPSAPEPTLALAAVLAQAGQQARAIELLERALRRSPLAVEYADLLARLLWQAGEHDRALERVLASLRIDPSSSDRWEMLAAWPDLIGERPRIVAAVRELADARPGSGWVRLGLAMLLDDDRVNEQLALLDEAVRLDPQLLEAHDRRAVLLMRAQRWNKALAACNPPCFGEPKPLILRGRAAFIRERRGDRAGALRAMRALVEEDPSYAFGWLCVAQWAHADGLVGLAARSYAELLRLNPDRADIASTLIELQIADGDLAAAERTLATLRRLGDDTATRTGALRLALASGPVEAMRLYEQCARESSAPEGWMLSAADTLRQSTTEAEMHRFLGHLIALPGVAAVVGYVWARHRVEGFADWLFLPGRLRALRARGPVGIEATAGYVERLAFEDAWIAFALFVWRERAALRSSTRLWGSVGFAYLVLGNVGRAREWLADWQTRPDLEAWIFHYLVVALRAVGDHAEAHQASEQALARANEGQAGIHRIWLVLDAAHEGRWEAARAAIGALSPPDTDEPLSRWLYFRSQALIARHDPNLVSRVGSLIAESERHDLPAMDARLVDRLRPELDRLAGR